MRTPFLWFSNSKYVDNGTAKVSISSKIRVCVQESNSKICNYPEAQSITFMRHITWYFSRLSGFRFHRKLAHTKTQQFTYKGRKHNGIQDNLWGSTGIGVNFVLYFLFYFLFVLIPNFCTSPWRLPAATASAVRFWNTVSYTDGQDTVAAAAILSLILWAGCFFFVAPLCETDTEELDPPLSVRWVGHRWHFPTQYAWNFPSASLLMPYSLS